MTEYSGTVTDDSGTTPKIGHLQSESAVTFGRNDRSRSIGISGQLGAEYAVEKHAKETYKFDTATWRYATPLDINNDGKRELILIWYPDGSRSFGKTCGLDQGPAPAPDRPGEIAFVLTPDGKSIDQAKTISTFGHPDGGVRFQPEPGNPASPSIFLKSYRTIGDSYGIFQFQGRFYFDTFFDADATLGDFQDRRKKDPELKNTLAVFERKSGKTLQVCEYQVTQ